MKIFSNISRKFWDLKTRLTQINESEPLSKLSLIVIIFLDIFILVTIFTWLEDHTRQLPTIESYMSYDCQNTVISADRKDENQRLDIIKNQLNFISYNYYPEIKDYISYSSSEIHPICNDIKNLLNTLSWSSQIKELFLELNDLQNLRSKIESELYQVKYRYDTAVLEKIADISNEAILLKDQREKLLSELNSINIQIDNVKAKIFENKDYKKLWKYVEKDNYSKQKQLEWDLALAKFWFPVKKLLMELVFLLPLFFIFWWWNNIAIRRQSGTSSLISSHLLVITFIPIFYKILEAIFEIIPKRFFEKILEFLASFKLLAIWYYILVLIWILLSLFIIYIIQKKIFNRSRLNEKRLMHNECYNCWKHLPKDVKYCPYCWVSQYRTCPWCKKDTYVAGKYCIECSIKLD